MNTFRLAPRIENIREKLSGYWAEDVWNVDKCPIDSLGSEGFKARNLNFSLFNNVNIRAEIKFFYSQRLLDNTYRKSTIWDGYYTAFKALAEFISLKYPNELSIIDINRDKFLFEYRTYLTELNRNTVYTSKNATETKEYTKVTRYINLYNQFYEFFTDYYDEREETEKDRWDVRKLSINFNETRGEYIVSFDSIVEPYRQWVKKYVKQRMVIQQNLSFARAKSISSPLSAFFKFIKSKYPDWDNLALLTRDDILLFIQHLRTLPIKGNSKNTIEEQMKNRVRVYLYEVQAYISYIQRLEWDFAPKKPINHLLFPEDFPKKQPMKADDIKYIPDEVWEQILDNLSFLNPHYVPVLLVLEASGFRISDTLLLKRTCLEKKSDGWWLVGDQRKVNYTNHKIPITDDIAAVIQAQIKLMDSLSTDSNPNDLLFPNVDGKRRKLPISAKVFNDNLNMLTHRCQIRDSSGVIFHVKNHAFRHRYGVNMINNGMNILHLQKLMAHASPEMTLIYAQINDSTLRNEWEKARFKGAVRLSPNGNIVEADLQSQAEENGLELEWIRHNMDSIRLDHGFCIKSPKLSCDFLEQTLEPPCIKNNCRSFHTDHTFLDYFKEQITKIESDIEIYKKSNRLRSIELIQPKLNRYKEIASSLEAGNGVYGLSKERREYTNNERKEVVDNGQSKA